jgi:acetyltransferase
MSTQSIDTHVLTEYESKKILQSYGIPVTRFDIAKTQNESVRLAKEIGLPVAMKILSVDIVHKTEAGGVKLGLSTFEDVERAFREIMEAAKRHSPKARIDGVCVEEFISNGVEVIIGVKQDSTFGPTIMFGLGGIFVELLKDVSLRVVPVTEQDVRDMIAEVKGYKIL